MVTVALSFSPIPAHVGTARLVAAAVARRAGIEESALDEVRWAVDEACSRAVRLHQRHRLAEPVEVTLSDEEHRLVVVVTDRGPTVDRLAEPEELIDLDRLIDLDSLGAPAGTDSGAASADSLPLDFGLAVVAGLVEDLAVSPASAHAVATGGTAVAMSWPLA